MRDSSRLSLCVFYVHLLVYTYRYVFFIRLAHHHLACTLYDVSIARCPNMNLRLPLFARSLQEWTVVSRQFQSIKYF
jgi:hypothetical protein